MTFKEDLRKKVILTIHFLNSCDLCEKFLTKRVFEDTHRNTLVTCKINPMLRVLIEGDL